MTTKTKQKLSQLDIDKHWESLKDEKLIFRGKVVKATGCSVYTFYRWMKFPDQIPMLAKEKIKEIIQS